MNTPKKFATRKEASEYAKANLGGLYYRLHTTQNIHPHTVIFYQSRPFTNMNEQRKMVTG